MPNSANTFDLMAALQSPAAFSNPHRPKADWIISDNQYAYPMSGVLTSIATELQHLGVVTSGRSLSTPHGTADPLPLDEAAEFAAWTADVTYGNVNNIYEKMTRGGHTGGLLDAPTADPLNDMSLDELYLLANNMVWCWHNLHSFAAWTDFVSGAYQYPDKQTTSAPETLDYIPEYHPWMANNFSEFSQILTLSSDFDAANTTVNAHSIMYTSINATSIAIISNNSPFGANSNPIALTTTDGPYINSMAMWFHTANSVDVSVVATTSAYLDQPGGSQQILIQYGEGAPFTVGTPVRMTLNDGTVFDATITNNYPDMSPPRFNIDPFVPHTSVSGPSGITESLAINTPIYALDSLGGFKLNKDLVVDVESLIEYPDGVHPAKNMTPQELYVNFLNRVNNYTYMIRSFITDSPEAAGDYEPLPGVTRANTFIVEAKDWEARRIAAIHMADLLSRSSMPGAVSQTIQNIMTPDEVAPDPEPYTVWSWSAIGETHTSSDGIASNGYALSLTFPDAAVLPGPLSLMGFHSVPTGIKASFVDSISDISSRRVQLRDDVATKASGILNGVDAKAGRYMHAIFDLAEAPYIQTLTETKFVWHETLDNSSRVLTFSSRDDDPQFYFNLSGGQQVIVFDMHRRDAVVGVLSTWTDMANQPISPISVEVRFNSVTNITGSDSFIWCGLVLASKILTPEEIVFPIDVTNAADYVA